MLVLPRLMVPASRSLTTTQSETVGTKPASTGEPNVVGTPATRLRSLTAVGTPCSGGSASPDADGRVGLVGLREGGRPA